MKTLKQHRFSPSTIARKVDSSFALVAFIAFAFLLFSSSLLRAQSWVDVGKGTNGSISAFTTYSGNLVAGGNFSIAGGNPASNIAEWNGTTWSALGLGTNGNVEAVTVYNGNLIAAGSFIYAGGKPSNNIAEWNGTTWSPLGIGMNGNIDAVIEYNGKLIAAGSFTLAGGNPVNNIAEWDGTTWSALSTGTNSSIYALTVYNGNLIAAGDFTTAGANLANSIAEWNGTTWLALGTGITSKFPQVYALDTFNGKLVVGGSFTAAGGNPDTNIAEWDGTSWLSMGTITYDVYRGLTDDGSNLYASSFYEVEKWNGGTSWSSLGRDSAYVLGVYNGNLYVGGVFLSNDFIQELSDSLTGMNDIAANSGQWEIYPNPNNGQFTIKSSGVNDQAAVVEIYNVMGQKIYSSTLMFHSSRCAINLNGQTTGIYLYRIINSEGKVTSQGSIIVGK